MLVSVFALAMASQVVQADFGDNVVSRKAMGRLLDDMAAQTVFTIQCKGTRQVGGSFTKLEATLARSSNLFCYEEAEDGRPCRRVVADGTAVYDADFRNRTYRKIELKGEDGETFLQAVRDNAAPHTLVLTEFLQNALAARSEGGEKAAGRFKFFAKGSGSTAYPTISAIVVATVSGPPVSTEYGYRTMAVRPNEFLFEYLHFIATKVLDGQQTTVNWKADHVRGQIVPGIDFVFHNDGNLLVQPSGSAPL